MIKKLERRPNFVMWLIEVSKQSICRIATPSSQRLDNLCYWPAGEVAASERRYKWTAEQSAGKYLRAVLRLCVKALKPKFNSFLWSSLEHVCLPIEGEWQAVVRHLLSSKRRPRFKNAWKSWKEKKLDPKIRMTVLTRPAAVHPADGEAHVPKFQEVEKIF
jgi:hypothetical protein